jgi:ribosome-binding protein aMBF1 (putative translation factor)
MRLLSAGAARYREEGGANAKSRDECFHGPRPRYDAHTTFDCNLKAVALKPSIGTIHVREADAQRQAEGRAGGNMRRLRAARGVSQEALAHECGINPTYLSSVERSQRNMSIYNIARLAKGLQIEPWRLLKDE